MLWRAAHGLPNAATVPARKWLRKVGKGWNAIISNAPAKEKRRSEFDRRRGKTM
jgi:hypothetical protein